MQGREVVAAACKQAGRAIFASAYTMWARNDRQARRRPGEGIGGTLVPEVVRGLTRLWPTVLVRVASGILVGIRGGSAVLRWGLPGRSSRHRPLSQAMCVAVMHDGSALQFASVELQVRRT